VANIELHPDTNIWAKKAIVIGTENSDPKGNMLFLNGSFRVGNVRMLYNTTTKSLEFIYDES